MRINFKQNYVTKQLKWLMKINFRQNSLIWYTLKGAYFGANKFPQPPKILDFENI